MDLYHLLPEFQELIATEYFAYGGHRYFLYSDNATDEPICLAWQKVQETPAPSCWPEQKNWPDPLLPTDRYTLTHIPHEQTARFYPLFPQVAVEAECLLRNNWGNDLSEPGGRQLFFVSYGENVGLACFFAYYLCSKRAFEKFIRFNIESFDCEVSWLTLTKPWASVEETLALLNITLHFIGEKLGAAEVAGS